MNQTIKEFFRKDLYTAVTSGFFDMRVNQLAEAGCTLPNKLDVLRQRCLCREVSKWEADAASSPTPQYKQFRLDMAEDARQQLHPVSIKRSQQ